MLGIVCLILLNSILLRLCYKHKCYNSGKLQFLQFIQCFYCLDLFTRCRLNDIYSNWVRSNILFTSYLNRCANTPTPTIPKAVGYGL